MGIPLDYSVDQNSQLLKIAADHARDIHAACADVAAVIFPSAILPPSEATVSAVSAKLRQIVADIETAVMPDGASTPPLSWQMLARSGFLREPDLIDFVVARVGEERLAAMVGRDQASLPTRLLNHANVEMAEAAQILLAAESLHRHAVGNAHLTLSPELLHKLCWRVAAALEVVLGTRRPEVIAAVRLTIAQYAEANRAQAAALKIVHFSNDAERNALLNPVIAGVHLHVAALSIALGLEQDHVVQLIGAGSCAPYAAMLAACGLSQSQAVEAIFLFRANSLTVREAGFIDSGYAALVREDALSETAKWASVRTQYLTFGQL